MLLLFVFPLPELRDYAAPYFTDDKPLMTAVQDLTSAIFRDFKYSPAATTVATPIDEVMRTRAGVCQDFAHVQIGCLRALGFAAQLTSKAEIKKLDYNNNN